MMVTEEDLWISGSGFKSQHWILSEYFSNQSVTKTLHCCCLKRPKINEKRPKKVHILQKKTLKLETILMKLTLMMLFWNIK